MIRPLRIAVLAKQVPRFAELRLRPDGRLQRDGLDLEINPFCRRAIAKGVELSRRTGGRCVVFTLGPRSAVEVLREAIAWGADEGVLVTDPAFAGSDTLATARALAAALRREGPVDLVFAGLNSVDADTGQVGPQLAELLDLPFLGGVRELVVDGDEVRARCERDDGYATARVALPVLLTAAERLCAPAKVPPAERDVPSRRIRVLSAAELGPGPWGQAGSATAVGEIRVLEVPRRRLRFSGPVAGQVDRAVAAIAESGVLTAPAHPPAAPVPPTGGPGPLIAVLAEPGAGRAVRELLGAAARLAAEIGGRTVVLDAPEAAVDPTAVWSWGADEVLVLSGALAAEDTAAGVASWARESAPWAILAPSTTWGREVAGRVAARLRAGLTGDAVELEAFGGRLVCWKPAFGGRLVAAVTACSPVQMATVRPGVLPLPAPRPAGTAPIRRVRVAPRGRVTVLERTRDDDPARLAVARAVVGVGVGVDPARYGELKPLLDVLGAELAATRKVTDKGWQPRSRQVGITGRAIAPRLYVVLGASGKFNHMAGVRGAGFVLAVNPDPRAPVFDFADAGIVADWAETVPLLAERLAPYADDGPGVSG